MAIEGSRRLRVAEVATERLNDERTAGPFLAVSREGTVVQRRRVGGGRTDGQQRAQNQLRFVQRPLNFLPSTIAVERAAS